MKIVNCKVKNKNNSDYSYGNEEYYNEKCSYKSNETSNSD
jgi:hypothetical protein